MAKFDGSIPWCDVLEMISIRDLRSYAALDATFGAGPQLIVGPNAAGKTTLLEAIVLLAWGRSHRTSADGELVRWGTELARIEGRAGPETIEVALVRPPGSGVAAGPMPGGGSNGGRAASADGSSARRGTAAGAGARKRIRVNGVPRRAAGLAGLLRTVVFAP